MFQRNSLTEHHTKNEQKATCSVISLKNFFTLTTLLQYHTLPATYQSTVSIFFSTMDSPSGSARAVNISVIV